MKTQQVIRNPLLRLVSRKGKSKFDDDVASLSSTQTARLLKDGSSTAGSERSLIKNTVCFDESQNTYHEPTQEDEGGSCSVEELWYSSDDCKSMKQQHVTSYKSICRMASRGASAFTADSYVGVLTRIYEESCCGAAPQQEELDEASQNELNELFQRYGASAQTGMEQKILHSVLKGKQSRRKQLVELAYNLAQQQQDAARSKVYELRV